MALIAGLILYLDSQQKYTGEYKDGKYHGAGVLKYGNGERFEGNFIEGKANGFGKFYLSNGEVLEGIWKDQKYVGPGRYIFSDGEVYKIEKDDKWIMEELSEIEL